MYILLDNWGGGQRFLGTFDTRDEAVEFAAARRTNLPEFHPMTAGNFSRAGYSLEYWMDWTGSFFLYTKETK